MRFARKSEPQAPAVRVEQVRAIAQADGEAFSAAWEEGRGMGRTAIISYALRVAGS